MCLNSAFANSASLAMFHRWSKSLQGLLLTGQWAAVQDCRELVQQKAQTRLSICNTAWGCFYPTSWHELLFFKSAFSCLTTCHLLVPNYMPGAPGALHSVRFSSGSPQRTRWEHHSDGPGPAPATQHTHLDDSSSLVSGSVFCSTAWCQPCNCLFQKVTPQASKSSQFALFS